MAMRTSLDKPSKMSVSAGQSPVCSLGEALGVHAVDPNRFTAVMHPHHGHGGSAQGGFCISQIQLALQSYFAHKHSKLNQPDTINIQAVFLARIPDGQVTIEIRDVSLGKTFSTIHVAIQHNGKDKLVGYACQANLSRAIGPTLNVVNVLQPPPAPADFTKMKDNIDPNWIRVTYPWSSASLIKSFLHAERWVPRYTPPPNLQEYWFRLLPNTQRITTAMLGSLIDNYARPPENWRPGSPGSHAGMLAQGYWQQRTAEHLIKDPSFSAEIQAGARHRTAPRGHTSADAKTVAKQEANILSEDDDPNLARQSLAYPTVMMNLEIKQKLPPEGVEWMYCRATTKAINGGKFDAEVVLMDCEGRIIATSNQLNLMLDMSKDAVKSQSAGSAESRL